MSLAAHVHSAATAICAAKGDAVIAKRSTITDVAREAGVSTKTVSRVLNDEPYVRPDVRERVRAAASDLQYFPNLNARGLITNKTYLIGLTYERPSPSYVVELQRGALARLHNERYRLIVLPFSDARGRAAELGDFLRTAALDATLLAPPSCDIPELLDTLDQANIKYGRLSPTIQMDRGACAYMDDVEAARSAAEHLIGLGHRRFGIIKGNVDHAATAARSEGYRQAFEAAGIPAETVQAAQGDFTFDSGTAAARELLAGPDRPSAILAQNDDMGVATIMAARDLGLDVPHDLSVVGFDDAEISRLSWPRLTTIRQPVFELAQEVMNGVLKLLSGAESVPAHKLDYELLVRQSTGSPNAA